MYAHSWNIHDPVVEGHLISTKSSFFKTPFKYFWKGTKTDGFHSFIGTDTISNNTRECLVKQKIIGPIARRVDAKKVHTAETKCIGERSFFYLRFIFFLIYVTF